MAKVTVGPRTLLYPLPTVLVGANVEGKPNFMAAAWCGIVNSRPPMLSVSLQPHRYTLKGIKANYTFSINIPSADVVMETDYCGIFSGSTNDKVSTCKFNIFYGKLGDAPLINECPVNLELRVLHILGLPSHVMIIGQVEEIHVTDSCLTSGEPDVDKIKPFLWIPQPADEYRTIGKSIGKGHNIGRELKK